MTDRKYARAYNKLVRALKQGKLTRREWKAGLDRLLGKAAR